MVRLYLSALALVRSKWNRFGRYVYYLTLGLYILFVAFLTEFTINTPAPYSAGQILDYANVEYNE